MKTVALLALTASAITAIPASAEPLQLQPNLYQQQRTTPAYIAPQTPTPQPPPQPVRYAAANSDTNLGGGFIEFLFGGNQ